MPNNQQQTIVNPEEFIALFNLPQEGYGEPIQLQDTTLGFSLYKEREEGFKSLLRVYISEDELKNDSPHKDLTVTASYGRENEDGGITVSSTNFKRGIDWPLELNSVGEFKFNVETNQITFKGETIEPIEVLRTIDRAHISPQYKLRGFWIRIKLRSKRFFAGVFSVLFKAFAVLHFLFTNQRVKIFQDLREDAIRRNPYLSFSDRSEDVKPIDILGVQVPQSAAFLYSFFHLLIYTIFYYADFQPKYVTTIFENNFLTLTYVVLSVAVTKKVLPIGKEEFRFLIPILRWLQNKRFSILTKGIRVSLRR